MEAAWNRYCEAEHSSSDDDDSSPSSSPEPDGGVRVADSCQRLVAVLGLLCPLDVRFSQMKMRHLFGDGRRIAEAIEAIQAVPCSEEEVAAHPGAKWRLQFPFPPIEVVRWRCKLRDGNGWARRDPRTRKELYASQENWFTLDNRRLYCLQEASMRFWPDRCVACVTEVLGCGPRHQLRKFRTMDSGQSIMVGSGAEGVGFARWSWREKASDDALQRPRGATEEADASDDFQNKDVFQFLSSLKQDDHERVDMSKKLSWVLRRENGARNMGLTHGEGGWVRVNELLQSNFLGGITPERFHELVADSNKQKQRYELKQDEHGERIRASGKKAPGAALRNAPGNEAVAQSDVSAMYAEAAASSAVAPHRAMPPERPPWLDSSLRSDALSQPEAGPGKGAESGTAVGKAIQRATGELGAKEEGEKVGILNVGEVFKAAAARTDGTSSSASSRAGARNLPPVPGSKQAVQPARGMQMMQNHMQMTRQMQAMSAMRQMQQAQAMYMAYQMRVRQHLAQLRAARQYQEFQAQMHMPQMMQQELQQVYGPQGAEWTQPGDTLGVSEEWYTAGRDGSTSNLYGMTGDVGENGWDGLNDYESYPGPTAGLYDQAMRAGSFPF